MSKYLKLFFLIFCLSNTELLTAQNLVLNPSFEEKTGCPNVDSFFFLKYVNHWSQPTAADPDYFNVCDTSGFFGVPSNALGKMQPKDGNAYAGAIFYDKRRWYKEYIQGELREPLIAGQRYSVTAYVKLTKFSGYSISNIGFYFSENKVRKRTIWRLKLKSHVTNPDSNLIDTASKWTKISGSFVANGGERYLIIGNFVKNKHSNIVDLSERSANYIIDGHQVYVSGQYFENYAYFYIDDISVIAVTSD